MPIKLMPDTDNMYHIKIYSGFPLGQDHVQHTTPRYEQDYTWWEDYSHAGVGMSNCLTGVCEFRSPAPPPTALLFVFFFLCGTFSRFLRAIQLKVFKPWRWRIVAPLLVPDKIGLCPPARYDPPPHGAARTNPYWLYKISRSQSFLPDEPIDLADASTLSNPSISLSDDQQSSLFFSGEEEEDTFGLGAGTSVDQFVLSDSTDGTFDSGDPLLFLSDSNDDNLDSAFIASNDFGEGQDYSLFDATA